MVTISEIALETGVSASTVSRILNRGTGNLRSDAAKRAESVLAAARKHGYVPNMTAKGLVLKRSFKIGVLATEMNNPVRVALMEKIRRKAQDFGYSLLSDSLNEDCIEESSLLKNNLDGVIISHPSVAEKLRRSGALPPELPVVTFGFPGEDPENNIAIDYRDAARQQTMHLIKIHGLRNIVFLGTMQDSPRYAGYAEAMRKAGLRLPKPWLFSGDYLAGGFETVMLHCSADKKTQALLCHNDLTAIGAMSALHQSGISVPEEIAVIGFDDIEVAPYQNPPLSSAGVDSDLLANALLEKLESAITGKAVAQKTECHLHFNYRSSCGCCQARCIKK